MEQTLMTNSFLSDRFVQEQRRSNLFKELNEASKRVRRDIRLKRRMYDPRLRDFLGFPVTHGFAYGNEYEQEKFLSHVVDAYIELTENFDAYKRENDLEQLRRECARLKDELQKLKSRTLWQFLFTAEGGDDSDGTDTDEIV